MGRYQAGGMGLHHSDHRPHGSPTLSGCVGVAE